MEESEILALFDFDSIGDPEALQECDAATIARVQEQRMLRDRLKEAAAAGNTKTLAEILKIPQAPVWANDAEAGYAVCNAIRYKHHESTEVLLQHGVRIDTLAVTQAVENADVEMLDLLLRYGWDINMQLGLTTPSALALATKDITLVAWLLEHGASPNARCNLNITPLSYAIQDSPLPVIRMLFECGGSVQHGEPLHYATYRTLPDYLDVLALILDKNPPINHILYQDDLDSYYQRRAFSLGTPLHEAAKGGRLDIVKVLIAKGANLLIRDSRGKIPLQCAERVGCFSTIEYLKPLTARETPPLEQFTEGKEATGFG